MSSQKDSVYKNSIFNTIVSSEDNTIKPFIDSTKKTDEYKNIMDKYTFVELKNLFKNKNNLIKKITTCDDELICEPFRVGIIKWLFYNAIEKLRIHNKNIQYQDCYYDAAGSVNPTSDYDLTVLSKYGPQIALTMFNIFLKIMNNEKTLPEVLDVNIYTKGIYLNNKINKNFSKNEIIRFTSKELTSVNIFTNSDINIYENTTSPKLFCIQPIKHNDKQMHIIYSLIKLVELSKLNTMIKNNHPYLFNSTYYISAIEKLKLLQNEFNKNSANLSKYNNQNQNIIKKYKLCNKYAVKVFDTIYNNNIIPNNFHENLCKVGYYSVESYYSNCAVNIVLIRMQMGIDTRFIPINYICTIIENLGDLNQHFNKKKNINDQYFEILDKSKYIYRILYALCQLENLYKNYKLNHNLKNACLSGINNNKLNKFIKNYRGKSKDINMIKDILIDNLLNIKLLESDITITEFIDKFNDKVINIIYDLIIQFDLSKPKTRKSSRKSSIKTSRKTSRKTLKIS